MNPPRSTLPISVDTKTHLFVVPVVLGARVYVRDEARYWVGTRLDGIGLLVWSAPSKAEELSDSFDPTPEPVMVTMPTHAQAVWDKASIRDIRGTRIN